MHSACIEHAMHAVPQHVPMQECGLRGCCALRADKKAARTSPSGKPPLPPSAHPADGSGSDDDPHYPKGVAREEAPSYHISPSLYTHKETKPAIRGMSGVHKTEKPMAPQVAAALAAVMKKNSLAVPEFNPLGLSKGTGEAARSMCAHHGRTYLHAHVYKLLT